MVEKVIHSWYDQKGYILAKIGHFNEYTFKLNLDFDPEIINEYFKKIKKIEIVKDNIKGKIFSLFNEKTFINVIKGKDAYKVEFCINIEEITKENVKRFLDHLNEKKKSSTDFFYTIGADSYGYSLEKNEVKNFDYNIELNYGEKFLEHDGKIKELLNKQSGLFLFHGEPGCGKTMYIRHLIEHCCKNLKEKKIIYVPSYMISKFTDPQFMSFIRNYSNIVLIIEDAEYCLRKRESNVNSEAVSNILNLTSGLLNDVTKCQIISTFNIELEEIDPALLRQGRLNYKYEFKKLKPTEVEILAKHLKVDNKIKNKSMNLSEIYNIYSFKNKNNKKRIEFKLH